VESAPSLPKPTWPLVLPERDEPVHLVLGPFDLWVLPAPEVGPGVRILRWRSDGDPDRPASLALEGVRTPGPEAVEPDDVLRVTASGPVHIAPRVPPMSVVARPETPVSLGVGETLRAFVGVPAWASVKVGDQGKATGLDLPLQTLQRTWVGTPTEGFLCFATRTHLRLTVDRLQHTAHRVACPVVVTNNSAEPLTVDRLVLPLPAARLYLASQAPGSTDSPRLWSEVLRIDHTPDGPVARTNGPPSDATSHGPAQVVGDAREAAPRGLTGVVSAVLSGFVG
jgi:hypothetical protein